MPRNSAVGHVSRLGNLVPLVEDHTFRPQNGCTIHSVKQINERS